MIITEDMLSEYAREIQTRFDQKLSNVSKVLPSLNNREEYILHYENLKLYTDLGVKI